jgi:tetratricopeptide (TPR) repeat protein
MSSNDPGQIGLGPIFHPEESGAEAPPPSRFRRLVWWLVPLVLAGGLMLWLGLGGRVQNRLAQYETDCRAAVLAGDWPQLEERALAWSQVEPQAATPWMFAAEAAQRQEQWPRAVEYLARVPESDPRIMEARLTRSDQLSKKLNRPLEAVADCQRIPRVNPQTCEAHRRVLYFYGMTLQHRKTIEQARAAISDNCDSPEICVYLLGADWLTFSNAYEVDGDWLQADPDNELLLVARALHHVGSKGLDEGTGLDPRDPKLAQHQQVLKTLDEYLVRYPKNLELLAHFLRVSTTAGDERRVAELLAHAPPEAAHDNRYWRHKGWLHAARQEFAEAEAAYRRALKLHPYDWRADNALAGVLRRQGRTEEAKPLLARATLGNALRKEIVSLPSTRVVPKDTLARMAIYARDCGDHDVADRLMLHTANASPK